MTTFDESQHPRRNGGKFATKRHAEPAALEKPYGADAYWNSNPDRLALESGFAQQLAGMPWASDTRQLARRTYAQIAIYRGIPSVAADEAEREATEKGDYAVWLVDDDPSPDVRGEEVYGAVLPIIEAVQESRYTDSGFVSSRRSVPAPVETPTLADVGAAKRRYESLEPIRPLFRPDWERRNGGRGPTVQQFRDEQDIRHERDAEIAAARAEWKRLEAAYEAGQADSR